MITEVPVAHESKRPRINRAALDPSMQMMAEQLDDLRDGVLVEVRGMRADQKEASGRFLSLAKWALGLFAVGGLVTLIGGGGVIYYTLSLFGELRGVDTSRAAESATTVISATSDAVTAATSTITSTGGTTTVTTTTPATDAPEAQPVGPTEEH